MIDCNTLYFLNRDVKIGESFGKYFSLVVDAAMSLWHLCYITGLPSGKGHRKRLKEPHHAVPWQPAAATPRCKRRVLAIAEIINGILDAHQDQGWGRGWDSRYWRTVSASSLPDCNLKMCPSDLPH